MFEAAKEAEMSVSDPEEYLVSRSDEDVLFPPHSMYVWLFLRLCYLIRLIVRL